MSRKNPLPIGTLAEVTAALVRGKRRVDDPDTILTLEEIAVGSGVKYETVKTLYYGNTCDPRSSTTQALYEFLSGEALELVVPVTEA